MKQPSNITPLCWTTSMRKNKEKEKEKIENKSKNGKKKRKRSKKSIRTKNSWLSKMKKEQNKQLIWRNKKNKNNTVANGGPLLSNN